ncbi:MAG TPA: protein kinase [Gemmatimonadales bacterium]|nr:protein kinase [Gemmatimonadales bacterium]
MLDLTERLQAALEGQYTIEREVGHGGMAVVYRARDLRHDRVVALKLLQPEVSEALGAERFLREIRVAARLHHPHLLPLYDSGRAPAAGGEDAFLYYVTPFIEGGSLRERLDRDGRLPLSMALRLALQTALALDYAHRQGVIHRDIKPANILLEEDNAIVADFGVARAVSAAAEADITRTGTPIGTAAYMSPEQATGAPLDGRSDVYALGCVLYEMLAGRSPFADDSPIASLARRVTTPAPDLRSAGVALPPAVEQLVARALAREPDARFQTAGELAHAIVDAERGGVAASQPAVISGATRAAPRVASLAVLPFVNMSTDPENEFFSDGMTEELINALSRVEGLRVAARTSAFAFKGRDTDVREIGQRLNVGAVLEGSVRRAGNRLRVSAQLIDAADGYHLWSETYDRQLADVFEVQDELSRSIVRTLRPKLIGSSAEPLVVPATTNLEAYTLYLQGRYFWNTRLVEGYRKAIELFERAVAADPSYPLPYTGIADCFTILSFDYYGVFPAHEGMPKAKAAALRALELDASLAEAHSSLGMVSMLYDWDWPLAEREFRRSLELNPDYVQPRLWYSMLLTVLRRPDEAMEVLRRATEVEPLSLIVHQMVARVLLYAGRYEEALDRNRRLLEMDPSFHPGYDTLVRALLALGRLDEAEAAAREGVTRSRGWSLLLSALGNVLARRGKREEAYAVLAELEEQSRQRFVPPYHFATVRFGFRDEEETLGLMEQGLKDRNGTMAWIGVEPENDWLVDKPRYRRLLREMRLP